MFAVMMSMFYVVADSLMNQVMVMEKVRIIYSYISCGYFQEAMQICFQFGILGHLSVSEKLNAPLYVF